MSSVGPTPAAVLGSALQWAHQTAEGTMADVTDEIANRPAPGKANPIVSCYAHSVIAEDSVANGILQQ